jgi:hypothetical protein
VQCIISYRSIICYNEIIIIKKCKCNYFKCLFVSKVSNGNTQSETISQDTQSKIIRHSQSQLTNPSSLRASSSLVLSHTHAEDKSEVTHSPSFIISQLIAADPLAAPVHLDHMKDIVDGRLPSFQIHPDPSTMRPTSE